MSKKLTDKQILDLVTKQKTGKMTGLIDPTNGEKVAGKIILDMNYNLEFEQI